ncbi:MAG TPA: hypothetical protein VK149_03440 [Sideroxyarcus sp.]|nr:hypothetical protein [Sideroxyarcus sp.]
MSRLPEAPFVPGRYVKPTTPQPSRPLRKLTAAEEAKVAENKALMYQLGPDAVDFMKELHAAGLVSGWRGVVSVEIFNEGKDHGDNGRTV